MAEIVNLRSARKLRERAKKRTQADANAAKFGRSRAERAAEEARADQVRRHLDGHRREPEEPGA